MALPGNGIFVVKGEISNLMAQMKRGARWSSHSYQDDDVDSLLRNFQELRDILDNVEDLRFVEPNTFLAPFLNVIRSEETTGPVTSLALTAVNKFLSYGLLDPGHTSIPQTIHSIADAVTHARFVGTDQSSDGVVLMRILQVLRTLTLSPEGAALTNESLCEIMLSCFRICFETRLVDLLRKTAEHYLKDMVQLIFMRLPQFCEDLKTSYIKQLKMKPGALDQTRTKRKKQYSSHKKDKLESDVPKIPQVNLATVAQSTIVDMQGSLQNSDSSTNNISNASPKEVSPCDVDITIDSSNVVNENLKSPDTITPSTEEVAEIKPSIEEEVSEEPTQINHNNQDYVNQRGIRFTPQPQPEINLSPYGLACVRELLRFLISLCNPLDKQNTEIMIHLGLTLLTVAFEISADNIGKYNTLLALVKDDLCRNLFSLMNTERLTIFALDLQVSFLLFESLRTHLKFQLEHYLKKLIDIILSDSPKVTYEHKEIALDNILQLWRIPGFHTELYINYDCDMYCANLYEELTKLLAKNSMSSTSGVYHTHLLSLDALLIIAEGIESRCSEEKSKTDVENEDLIQQSNDVTYFIGKSSRIKISEYVPKKEELAAKKSIKKWLPQGTEYFNQKPKKGIQFLQEHGVLKPELDINEIATFLRENPALNKAMIGEYISNRSNLKILQAFVDTFNFTGVRIDEALRAFLETFRLPGEAPTISLILEHFAETWHKSNNEPFADVDSAFTLAYAIIMLNVDQHNENAKKQTTPMSASAFKKNLKGVNGGNDFDEEMLDDIYTTIKNEEIIMPAEQTGLVRENYFWKLLLRKGQTKDGIYIHDNSGTYDSELFHIVYGPIVAALSSIYEKTESESVHKKVMQGFEKCASIAANLNMSINLDMLILSISKFTIFYNQQKQNNIVVQFGMNFKAQLALRTVFSLIHQHGNTMREGWKHLFDLLLALYSNGLLSKTFIEVEDFIEPTGKLLLVYKEAPSATKQDTGLLSSIYSYMVSAENLSKIPTPEEQNYIDAAKECIKDCNLEQMITDSKFLHEEALFELVQTLIDLSRGPDVHESVAYDYNDNVTVFFLELLIKVVIQNRDRVMTVWQKVRDHIYTLVMNASVFDFQFLLERSVIGLLRIAIRLMRNEEMSHIVLQSLRMLLLLKSSTLSRISRQISFGLYELLKTSAQNIHTNTDWTIIFTLLECVGAGAQLPKPITSAEESELKTKSDGETFDSHEEEGAQSDSDGTKSPKSGVHRSQSPVSVVTSPIGTPNTGGWILVGNEGEIQPVLGRTVPPTQYGLALEKNLGNHDPRSMMKCCESLAFLVRDVAHITPYNFDVCVHCIRTFVEASLHGVNCRRTRDSRSRKKTYERNRSRKSPTSSQEEEESDDENIPSGYHQISIQLLDLMHTLHTRTAQIFKWWAEEGGEISQDTSLWTQGWCPLLQGIARLCCDTRRPVRMSAITYLQRALLVHDLQTLSGSEWEQCFQRVLFPLLSYLLQPVNPKDAIAMEETRIRAATVLSKVFLHHLNPLLSLPSFFNLWLIVLDFMDKYMHADKSELLYEAIPESLKNMLLVMDSAKVFDGPDGKNILWNATWDRISKFLPNMKDDLFKEIEDQLKKNEGVANDKIVNNEENNAISNEKLIKC
ncbi:Golgi-specific brefeldin A-resistance guanine nucleotide exchange factor 1 [Diorhabda carinulata]|uniref:Golgi-specific brefeldin A-resistance guanine nucleotide exchange factor 1 n=1 Tax=Diorhabda carinulata TaxID=1163345 RepID=UPI0025A07ACF|nr:Golgi-specific brefeldin A-resistance guanine nucleotide exchange factor 1 [Diorhabda carinulata]